MKKFLAIIVLGLLLAGCNTNHYYEYANIDRPRLTTESVKIKSSVSGNELLINNCKFIYQIKKLHADKSTKEIDIKYATIKIQNHIASNKGTHFVIVGDKIVNRKKAKDQGLDVVTGLKAIELTADVYDCPKKYSGTNKEAGKPTDITSASGTAFFINKDHLITNHHVIKGCNNKSKIIYQNKEVDANLIAKDAFLDLALLKVDVDNDTYISISDQAPSKLQRIIVAGYPFGKYLSDDMKVTAGIISSLKGLGNDSTRLQIDAALNRGNSGGPIVDAQNGKLVAVAVATLNKDKIDNQAVNYGIKASSVKNFLNANKINLLKKSKYSSNNAELSNMLENATMYTFCN
jgi:S1-C subfamily serine protease